MKTDIMEQMKLELVTVKNIIEKYGVYDIGYPESVEAFTYFVILSNGVLFYITMGSTIFPDIDFDKIIYIRKHIALDCSKINKEFEYYDTDNGFFNCNSETKYDNEIVEKYNVSFDNEILTGNYD